MMTSVGKGMEVEAPPIIYGPFLRLPSTTCSFYMESKLEMYDRNDLCYNFKRSPFLLLFLLLSQANIAYLFCPYYFIRWSIYFRFDKTEI